MPRDSDCNAERNQRDQQHRPLCPGGLVACAGDSPPRQFEMAVTNRRSPGDDPAQYRIRSLVVLDERFSFSRDRDDTVRGFTIRA
jgi:hypothetical protein